MTDPNVEQAQQGFFLTSAWWKLSNVTGNLANPSSRTDYGQLCAKTIVVGRIYSNLLKMSSSIDLLVFRETQLQQELQVHEGRQ